MSARILVVDDVDMNVKLLEAKLSSEYFNVITANDGQTAINIAQEERPDLILLDVMMPRMDGFETCRRLKADPRTVDIPVVMVTALTETADRVRGLEAGADDFLTKPVNDIALFARVRSLVRLRRMMEEWLHREEVYGQFNALFDKKPPVEDHGMPSRVPASSRCWRRSPARSCVPIRPRNSSLPAMARSSSSSSVSPARPTRCAWCRNCARRRPAAWCRSC
jgi:CheY-like chemotaxis protein